MDDFVPAAEDEVVVDEDEEDDDEDDSIVVEDVKVRDEASAGMYKMFQDVPPGMVAAYKKRFPNFWRMQQGLTNHSGLAYDQEEDPDYYEETKSSSSSDEDQEGFEDAIEENEDMEKEIVG